MPTPHITHTKTGTKTNDIGFYATAFEGGTGGGSFDDSTSIDHILDATLVAIRLRAGEYIDAIQFCYTRKGQSFNAPPHGGSGGSEYEFLLNSGEYITRVEGRSGKYIDQLRFITNKGTTSRIYGGNGGGEFFWQADASDPHSGLQWIGGRSGSLVDGLQGFYAKNIVTAN